MSDVYVALYIATTCDDSSGYISKDATETIEISWSLIDSQTLEISSSDRVLIKPVHTPITPFCTHTTGLTYDDVKLCGSFKDAISVLDKSIQDNILSQNLEFSFVSMDISRLRVQLPREACDKGVVLPLYLQYPRVFDLLVEYARWQLTHPETLSYSGSQFSNILTALEVDLDRAGSTATEEGSTTSSANSNGLSPATTPSPTKESKDPAELLMSTLYSKVLIQLAKKSFPVADHPEVLTKPYDLGQDVKAFLTERSKVLYLSNLPFDTTQSEIETWFTQYGARPIAFWTLKNVDSTSQNGVLKSKYRGISGFAVFVSHEEATESLSLNGRALNNRPVEILPSSTKVLDKASELLTPFPPSKNRPRPGDWTCPSCGFSNFQRRTACFRCSFPVSSATAFQDLNHVGRRGANPNANGPSGGSGDKYYDQYSGNHNGTNHHRNNNGNNGNAVPFRAGDWKCTNEACQYHNFAKNLVCLKCGINKPHNILKMGHMQLVSSTAAAIAAATASGQSLNLSNNYVNNQQLNNQQLNNQQLNNQQLNNQQLNNQQLNNQQLNSQSLNNQQYNSVIYPSGGSHSTNISPINSNLQNNLNSNLASNLGSTNLSRTSSNGTPPVLGNVQSQHLLTQHYLSNGKYGGSQQGLYQYYPQFQNGQLQSNQLQNGNIQMGSYGGLNNNLNMGNNLSNLDSNINFNTISNQFGSLNLNN